MKRFNSIKTKSLFYGFLLWLFVQIPISIFSANYFLKRDIKETLKQRLEITQVLSENFTKQARYGEFLQAAKNIDELAKTNELIQVGVCKNGADIRGFFHRKLCSHNKNTTYKQITVSGHQLELVFNWKSLPSMSSKGILINIVNSIALGFLVIFGTIIILSFLVSRELSNVSLSLSKVSDESNIRDIDNQNSEIKPLVAALSGTLNRLSQSNKNYFELKYKHESELKRLNMARQVAHDIRSPLTCLETVAKRSSGLNENEKSLIEKSVKRINEVAEDLLSKERDKTNAISKLKLDISNQNVESVTPKIEPVLLSQLIKDSIVQKNIEYSGCDNLKIQSIVEPLAQNTKVKINSKEFNRVFSNLINNAIEALKPNQPGFVSSNLSLEDDQLILEIRDNGKGIAKENLDRIFDEGVSIEKANGSGLGLSYARQVVESINGKVQVFSRESLGTTVRITLPV